MKETKLEISKNCWLDSQKFDNGNATVWLNYVERSPAHGFNDTETAVDIEKDDAERIVNFLQEQFDLTS